MRGPRARRLDVDPLLRGEVRARTCHLVVQRYVFPRAAQSGGELRERVVKASLQSGCDKSAVDLVPVLLAESGNGDVSGALYEPVVEALFLGKEVADPYQSLVRSTATLVGARKSTESP
ncbi:hypothetical protein [Streptomyces sp. IB2014 016-6]|uniref:hypothetical protein n=1 Tax=Streptomyces sp. IB2014 016-6 TaxID=2517818 RepID=UPI0011D5C78D|nr:hypothetical protein [Streptomyces sp. IB2014 016-6]TXL84242.1 hypothetical protein EW053_34730 [Streptomyces sp. IB2014 016-6]